LPVEPGQNLLHYRIIEKIGEGGMGVVWKAEDTSLGRDVAIKVLPATWAGDAERLQRFEREARLPASLNHPNVATVHGLQEAETTQGSVRFIAVEREMTTLQKTTLVVLGILATGQLLHADERTDPSLALPFQSKALHTEYRENLSDEEKLAGLSLVWSEAKYNFANFDLVPQLDWDARYMAFVPRVLATADTTGYYGELQRFFAGLNDGHSNVTPPREIRNKVSRPPVYSRLIGGEVVIYLVDSLKLLDEGLAVGQVIRPSS
jgi:hypothetical protein